MTMRNFYLLNETYRWAAVCIAKNACSSLKARVLEDSGVEVPQSSIDALHNRVGFTGASHYLEPVGSELSEGWTKFVITRDPVERLLSVYKHFSLDGYGHYHLSAVRGAPFDTWLDFTEVELKKPPLLQDEHLRPQSSYFQRDDVDHVVPLKQIDHFFSQQGWPRLGRVNKSRAAFIPSSAQIDRIQWLYRADLSMIKASISETNTIE